MKKIGLIIATKNELDAFLQVLGEQSTKLEDDYFNIYKVTLNNSELYAINCNVGIIKASVATTYLINKFNVHVIINYGVVGALVPNLNLKNTVLVNGVIHYDVDTSYIDNIEKGRYFDLPSAVIEVNSPFIDIAKSLFPKIDTVYIASGDKFINDFALKNELFETFGAKICDMESAGICLTSNIFKIPTLFIKSISDTVEGDASEYIDNATSSAICAFDIVRAVINELDKEEISFKITDNLITILDHNLFKIGELKFEKENNYLVLKHVNISEDFTKQGYAKLLVDEYFKYLSKNNLKTKIECSYALNYIEKYPQNSDFLVK